MCGFVECLSINNNIINWLVFVPLRCTWELSPIVSLFTCHLFHFVCFRKEFVLTFPQFVFYYANFCVAFAAYIPASLILRESIYIYI